MNQEILCTWLGLPKTAWPPDAWSLLGLPPGDHDLPTLEECVQNRMTKLRCYQLTHPDEATEGMNRLAEAFITLTETCRKKPASETIASVQIKAVNGMAPVSKDETSVIYQTKLDWHGEPPPVRQETESAPELIVDDGPAVDDVPVSHPFVAPTKPQRREIEPELVRHLAEESEEATSNVATLEAVIERVEGTRRLLHAWERAGRHLRAATRKATVKDSEQFAKRLAAITAEMQAYPAFLGHPGLPGYRVVVLARLNIPLLMVRTKTEDQREELLFDWRAGHQVLLRHRKYLRTLFKSMRHRTAVGRFFHALRATLNDYPKLTLVGMVLVVLLALVGGTMLALR